jgi:hypothetical protein
MGLLTSTHHVAFIVVLMPIKFSTYCAFDREAIGWMNFLGRSSQASALGSGRRPPRPCRPNPFVALACASCRRSLRTLFFFVLSVLALARALSFCPVVRVQTKATDCVSEGQKTAAATIVFVAVPIWDALVFWDSSPFMATFYSYSSEREWAQARESWWESTRLQQRSSGDSSSRG